MALRGKLTSAIIAPAIISVAIVSVVTSLQINTAIKELMQDATTESLKLTDQYINEIINSARNTTKFMASLQEVRTAMGKWTRYFEQKVPTKPGSVATDPSEKMLYQLTNKMKDSHPDFAYVYIGLEDGGYVQQGEETINTDYDPRKRPWYQDGKNAATDTLLQNAYMTTMGHPNLAVSTKVYDDGGTLIGVSTVDISLARLTDIIKNLSVGNTGYVMLLQGDGTIISDPKFPDHNFKKLSDLNLPDYDRIGNTTQGTLYGVDIAGTIYGCKVETSAKTGWKLVALIEEQELHAASGKIITHILVIAVSVLLVSAFLGSLFVTRGVIRPINALVSMTQDISAGKYDAIPRQAAFKSEFKILFDNMKLMVEKLVSTIASNEKKTLEADEKTLQATTALAEAAEARKQAEHARAEGMLQAAQQLEGIVKQVTSISETMQGDSQTIRRGAEVQSERIQSTASAMEEMTATILEVARNSTLAVSIANEAKQVAQQGQDVVQNTIDAMQATHEQTEKLNVNMHLLGEKTEAIGVIITVIEDIADQTNLLALNAAIEAARAGEAGRGFAVVADEVRKLAEKTMGATKEVGSSIKAIQQGAQQNIHTVEKASGDLDKALKYSSNSGEILTKIVNGAANSADQIQSIATASEEQSAATEEINHSVEDVNRIASETVSEVEGMVGSLNSLTMQLDTLNILINDLKSDSNGHKTIVSPKA